MSVCGRDEAGGEGTYIFDGRSRCETVGFGAADWRFFGRVADTALKMRLLGFDGGGEDIARVLGAAAGDVFAASGLADNLEHVEEPFGPLIVVFGRDVGCGDNVGTEGDVARYAGEVQG